MFQCIIFKKRFDLAYPLPVVKFLVESSKEVIILFRKLDIKVKYLYTIKGS